MRLKISALALSSMLTLGLGASAALGQDAPPPPMQQGGPGGMHHGPMTPEQQMDHLTKALNLTSDQQTQIKPILLAHHQQMMQLHQDTSLSRDEKMPKMKALDEDSHAKISAILDDKQKAKFEKMAERREAREGQGGPMGQMGPGQPPPPQQ